jgi:hypothetical protein
MKRAREADADVADVFGPPPPQPPPPALLVASAAGEELRLWIERKWGCGRLNAEECCTLAHLATQAGAIGVTDLSVSPMALGRNQSRLLRARLIPGDIGFYEAEIPSWEESRGLGACSKVLRFLLPHEIYFRENAGDDPRFDPAARDPRDVAVPSYREHPVAQAAAAEGYAGPVLPVSLYADSTPCRARGRDSVHASYVSVLHEGQRRAPRVRLSPSALVRSRPERERESESERQRQRGRQSERYVGA